MQSPVLTRDISENVPWYKTRTVISGLFLIALGILYFVLVLPVAQGSTLNMALDDPVVWVLIVAVIVFLFGANKIPQIAKGIGQARREFEMASKGITDPLSSVSSAAAMPNTTPPNTGTQTTEDPLITAAKKEGIETQGKTRDQIASELAWKLKKPSN